MKINQLCLYLHRMRKLDLDKEEYFAISLELRYENWMSENKDLVSNIRHLAFTLISKRQFVSIQLSFVFTDFITLSLRSSYHSSQFYSFQHISETLTHFSAFIPSKTTDCTHIYTCNAFQVKILNCSNFNKKNLIIPFRVIKTQSA